MQKTVYFIVILLIASIDTVAQDFTSSNLPIVIIDTNGQAIKDEDRIVAEMDVIDNGPGKRNYLTDTPNDYDGYISIELRGSSSQGFPKKQYALETQTETGENNNVMLLGLPTENDWILNGPYSDKSLIRNVLEYEIARKMGRYASRTRLCELVLNNDYRGVYVLLEKIKRDNDRVDIATLNPDEIEGDDLTGGYIIKIDKWEGSNNDGWSSPYPPYPGSSARIYYQYHYPKPDEIVAEQKTYIRAYITSFEEEMFTTDYSNPENKLPAYIDMESFVDFFILNEISRNVDGYRLSTFLYKDKDSNDGKLVMGPLWDFNLAFGNADYYNGSSISGWQIDFYGNNDGFQIPFWWDALLDSDNFRRLLYTRWTTLREDILKTEQIHYLVDSLVAHLWEAQQRNFERWDVLGHYVWPNYFVGDTYQEEIDYMKNWIEQRLDWIDEHIPKPTGITDAPVVPSNHRLEQNYPNPFNATTTIRYYISDSRSVATQNIASQQNVEITIHNISGQKIATLVSQNQAAGAYSIRWHAKGSPSGLYFCLLRVNNTPVRTKKLLLVK